LNRFTGGGANNGITILNTSNSGLSSNTILSLHEDYEGSLWMTAGGSGIDRIKDPKFTVWGKKEGLQDDIFSTVTQDRAGAMWLGSFYNTGVTRLVNGKSEHFDYDGKNGFPQGAFVRAVCETRSGVMLFGTTGLGLVKYENGKFTHILGSEGLSQNTIRAIFEDQRGTIWIGTFGAGLYRLQNNTLLPAYSTASGLGSDFIVAIAQDAQERLWLATRDGGVSILSLASGTVTTLMQKDGLPRNTVLYVVRDNDGVMWVGTQFGIALCKGNSIKTLTAKNGLPEDITRWMVHDSLGDYWLSGLAGIYHIPKDQIREFLANVRPSIQARRYGKSDGMRSVECNGGGQPAAWATRDGALWFPTMKGMVTFHSRRLAMNTITPPVVVEDLIANEKKSPFALGEIPKLRAGIDRITIRYTALSLLFPDKVEFKYKLEGLDEDWIDAGQRREAFYTNLSPKEYTFRVIARNNDGVWNEAGAELAFVVKPKFYQTWWFYTILALVLCGLVWLVFQWRIRLLRQRERELAKLVDERTAEIQRQMTILDEQATEIELRNSQLQEKNFLIEEERQKSEMLLLNILPPKIAERLKGGEKIIADKFDSVTVLFADIVGFTKMSARVSPEHLVENLSMIFTTFDLLAAKYKLEKIKTIGDAYMLVGGLPEPIPNHSAQVVRMALEAATEMRILTEDTEEKIAVRIGLHTGPVVAGVIGMRKFAYDLWGDTVNIASRMESSGEPWRVHCSEEVYLLLRDTFEFEERGTIEVKGKGQMRTYFVIREKLPAKLI
jgi:class 3 adenylate cyclase/streptogramin lyase